MLSRTKIQTAHFGCVAVDAEEVLRFPLGLPGLENRRRWVLLTPPADPTVSWLQSVECPETALAVVDPCCFVPDYQLRTHGRELEPLELTSLEEALVLVTVNRTSEGLTLDLKAPLVINTCRRLGRQVIANNEMPLRHLLQRPSTATARKTA